MSRELKKCPFCAGNAKLNRDSNACLGKETARYYVLCERCYAIIGPKETKQEAIAAWNRRA